MHSKRLLSIFLSGAMMLSALPMASAAYQTPVTVTSEAAIFNVTIPTALPVSVNDHGAVTTATNAVIINDSWGPVIISGLAVAGTNDWATVDYDSANMTTEKVNTKKVAMDINTCKTTGANTINFQSSGFGSIHGKGGTQAICYDAKLPAQASAISSQDIVNVTFTVAWNKAEDRSWDTNPMTSTQVKSLGIPYDDFCGRIIGDRDAECGRTPRSFYTGSATTLQLPSSIDGIRVVKIGSFAFYNCSKLTSVTIPSSITSIGDNAFNGCAGLSSVTIPDSVTLIYTDAFKDVPHIYYHGTATGAPWGAKAIN